MLICTSWKGRALTPDQMERLMSTWGKLEAKLAEDARLERQCWYLASDGASGFTVIKADDDEAVTTYNLETCLALGEFLELDSKVVVDLDGAMPSILKSMEYAKG